MPQASQSFAAGVRWDLSDLFSSPTDPKLDAVWSSIEERSARFEERYRGRLSGNGVEPDVVLEAIREIEGIYQDLYKPLSYAHLLFAADTSDPKLGAFLQSQMERMTPVNVRLMFFELELQAWDDATAERIQQAPQLAEYRHYLQVVRRFSPHRLTEPEERILEELANTGVRAWVRLFEEVTSNHVYRLKDPGTGEWRELSMEQVIDLLREPDRALRQAAADSLTDGLKALERVLVFNYNNLMQAHAVEDRLRRHPFPEHSRHLSNELEKETVDLVVGLCRERSEMVARYYRIKRDILGLPELTHIDRYAPLGESKERVPFEEARGIVLDSFREFSPRMAEVASEFFERGWIDAEPRPGKRGGAFCSYVTPDTHPVVFLTYLGKLEDVSTLAHELGHGVHASLSRKQTLFNFSGTLPLAELASVFGEMLVFEKLLDRSSDEDRLALYASKIEGSFATVFRQAAMFRFEQRCHRHRREKGELTAAEFAEIWQEEMQSMFGDSLVLGEQHGCWWSYVSHFVASPFYVYAYSFGELLVLSLFERSRREGPAFAEKYLQLLEKGGSQSPAELLRPLEVDLNDPAFWNGGLDVLERTVRAFETLWSRVKA
ncbi:MAG: M3 family oligoendopeptidase [Fimbriimonadales bacterium]|nr:M3 family oligoendopeptidase [Fimbriimonadales bacterium]